MSDRLIKTMECELIGGSIEMPSRVVRFHEVVENGEVVDTLAVLEDGRSVSLTVLFGDTTPNA